MVKQKKGLLTTSHSINSLNRSGLESIYLKLVYFVSGTDHFDTSNALNEVPFLTGQHVHKQIAQVSLRVPQTGRIENIKPTYPYTG